MFNWQKPKPQPPCIAKFRCSRIWKKEKHQCDGIGLPPKLIDVYWFHDTKEVTVRYETAGSSGFDILAQIYNKYRCITMEPQSRQLIHTGLYVQLDKGYELQIRSRSGLALKHGIVVLNSPATIDSDYEGEIKVLLANFGDEPFKVKDGMRIAQGVICKIYRPAEYSVARGVRTGGFGSTGL